MGGNIENLNDFIKNFNEAYDRVKNTMVKNNEISKLFNLTIDAIRSNNPLMAKVNPEVQKKIKYNYLLNNFIKEYKRVFPIYTVFNQMELKDKQDFSGFISNLA